MSVSSKELLLFFLGEINKLRTHPKAFLKHLEDRTLRFKEDDPLLYQRGDIPNIEYKTVEGAEGPRQAHDYLMEKEEAQPLELSLQLCEVAYTVGSKINANREQVDIRPYEKELLAEM
jgi:hypothetical protein